MAFASAGHATPTARPTAITSSSAASTSARVSGTVRTVPNGSPVAAHHANGLDEEKFLPQGNRHVVGENGLHPGGVDGLHDARQRGRDRRRKRMPGAWTHFEQRDHGGVPDVPGASSPAITRQTPSST